MIDFGVSTERFIEEYYEKQFFVRKGALAHRPVTWKDINSTLFAWDPRDGLLQLFKDGPIPVEHYTETFVDLAMQRSKIVKDTFYELLQEGATLVLNRLETKSEPVHDLAMEIARFVGEKAVANGYAAFGGRGTFAQHWDTHDVFAVQLIGRKRWRVFAPTFALPLPHQKSKEHKHECPAEPVFDGYLEAGDMLYIPRGWWHEAVPLASEETFHIAVGIHPMLIRDYVAWSCFKTLPSDIALRQSIKAERDNLDGLALAAQAAEELLVSKTNLAEFKREVFSNERVVSRFAIETLGKPGASGEPQGQFRLNSVYRTASPASTNVYVNGQAIRMDAASQRHIASLFSRPRASLEEISKSPDQREKTSALLQQLADKDVISPVPDYRVATRSIFQQQFKENSHQSPKYQEI